MSKAKKKQIEELADIMRALADVWLNDREGVTIAGAKFEQSIDELGQGSVQLQRLIDLAWQGMRHLYEEDSFFLSVKHATLHSINTIREYHIHDGNITIEDFEKSCETMEKALAGDGESADKIIELDALPAEPEKNCGNGQGEKPAGTTKPVPATSLNDLASLIMETGDPASTKDLEFLSDIIGTLADEHTGEVRKYLEEAQHVITKRIAAGANSEKAGDWYEIVSEKTEAAMGALEDQKWENEEVSETISDEPSGIGEDTGDEETIAADKDIASAEKNQYTIPGDIDPDMVKEFISECSDLIETAESALLDLEDTPGNDELINAVFRAFHTIKGTSAFMELDPVTEFTHAAETLLSMVRDGELPFDRACADICFSSIDIIKKFLSKIAVAQGGDPLPTTEDSERIIRVLNRISEEAAKPSEALEKEGVHSTKLISTAAGEIKQDQTDAAGSPEASKNRQASITEETDPKTEQEATVRINLNRLDRLIDMVGELVIAHAVVSQDRTIAKDIELMKKVDHATKILRELQDTSLTLRMVPLRSTFQKMNRLVRDLARKAGKDVRFATLGEDTEIDRNMVDIINEPLVHMLRNSIDHGVETPQMRVEAGKPAKATIWLRAYQEGGKVIIEIEDDGKGIDKEKVLQKAIEKELVPQGKKLTDNEICGLIFHPGLSSVDKVTDLSGRGVGMDVVKRSIEQLQGKVDVESVEGKGTKISLELPFTLAITDGMLVTVGSQKFIIPTISIDMTFRAKKEDIFTIFEHTEQVKYQGNSVPVIRLHKLFEIPGAVENLGQGTLIAVKISNKVYALLVDEIIGQQQLVGKSINMNVKMPHISGGAILGDGRVGLILDTAAIVAA